MRREAEPVPRRRRDRLFRPPNWGIIFGIKKHQAYLGIWSTGMSYVIFVIVRNQLSNFVESIF